MDALTFPLSNRLMVLTAPHAASTLMLELAARLFPGLAGALQHGRVVVDADHLMSGKGQRDQNHE